MKNLEIIKKYAFAIAAIAMAVGFSAFKMNESKSAKILAPVTIYFHGSPSSSTDVEETSLWTEQSNNENCATGDNKACSMSIDESALTGTYGERKLDPSKINLVASGNPASGFIPDPELSSGQLFDPINRN